MLHYNNQRLTIKVKLTELYLSKLYVNQPQSSQMIDIQIYIEQKSYYSYFNEDVLHLNVYNNMYIEKKRN